MKQNVFAPTVLVFISGLGIIVYIFFSSAFPFKDKLFNLLYPKTSSQAQEPLLISIAEPIDRAILLGNSKTYIKTVTPENLEIAKVQIFVNDELLCELSAPPYVCAWNVIPGKGNRHTIFAKAYDNYGRSAENSITITAR